MQNTTKVLLKLPNHHAHVVVDESHIRVFKYNNRTCDFGVFTHQEQDSASDYIAEELPIFQYVLSIDN